MAFDLYEPIEKDKYIESIVDFPEGSLVMLNDKGEEDLKAVLDSEMDLDEFLDDVQKRFDRFI